MMCVSRISSLKLSEGFRLPGIGHHTWKLVNFCISILLCKRIANADFVIIATRCHQP